MSKLRNLLTGIEYRLVRLLTGVFGVSLVVRYLRNPNPALTVRLLRAYGAAIGERTTVKGALYLDNVYEDQNSTGDFSHLRVGNNSYIGDGVYMDLAGTIDVADNVMLSACSALMTHADCTRSSYLAAIYPRRCAPVSIGEGAWVGVGVKIMPGVTIGPRSVMAVGAVVGGDVEPMAVYAGIPARKVKSLDERGVRA